MCFEKEMLWNKGVQEKVQSKSMEDTCDNFYC